MALFVAHTETPYTVLTADTSSVMELLGATTVDAELVEFGVSFNGTTANQAPILVKLRQISATGTGTACTEFGFDRSTLAAACAAKHTLTAEPTMVANSALGSWYVHPQGGVLVMQYPLDARPKVADGAAVGLAIELTSAASVTPNCVAYMIWHE
jgi:hypothetical protein